jgi:hypothetical protein
METSQESRLPPPPGLITSLQAGFDAIASHIYLILVPLALDVFLWLGPHLRIEELVRPMLRGMVVVLSQGGMSSGDLALLQSTLQEFTHGFNVFALLRTLPIGIPSLNYGRTLLETPFREPLMLEVTNLAAFSLAWVTLTLAGWIAGSLFYHWIAETTAPARRPEGLKRAVNSLVQGVLLCGLWALLVLLAAIPISILVAVLAAINTALAQVALLLAMFAFMWLLPLIFFSGHGIFAYQQNLFQSIGTAFRMTRFTLPSSALFILSALLISRGLVFLWRVPPSDSWLTMVGIAGHAFVTTALLAASFIYFRNVNSWLQIVLDRLRAQPKSISA